MLTALPTSLIAGSFQLTLGQLSDLLGRKLILLFGMGLFSAGCLITSFARNPFWMDILCGVLGLASAMVVPPAVGILGAAYRVPCKRKNFAFACFSAGNPLGFALGSFATGVASKIFDWRASFIFLCMLWAVFTVACVWIVPGNVESYEPAPFRTRAWEATKKFDIVGTVLTVLGVGFLTAALTLGPADGWSSAIVISLLVVGFCLLVVFVLWESYWPYPLMPLKVWKIKGFPQLVCCAVFGLMSFVSSNFWLSLFMQRVLLYEPLEVALHLLPQVIAGVIWNIVAANILHRVNNTVIMAVGAVAYLTSSLLLSFTTHETSYWRLVFPALVICVLGADLQFNVANVSTPIPWPEPI